MAGASYLFFLTVLLFFRGTIGVDNSINFINLLENYGLYLETNIPHEMEVDKTLDFSVGILLRGRSTNITAQVLDVQLDNPLYQSRSPVLLHFFCSDDGFHILSSGGSNSRQIEVLDFTYKNVEGFIVDVIVSNDGTKSKVSYIVKLCDAGGTVYSIPEMVDGPHVYKIEYVLTRVNVSELGMGQIFFSDGIEFVNSPPRTSLTTFRPMFPLHILKLQDESRTVIVRAFPEFIDGYAELQFQFYNSTTGKNVEEIFCLSVALNGTVLTIKESITGEPILVLNRTRPDGILVQFVFSTNPRYGVNAYKNGDCIKRYAGDINGVSNRVVLKNKNFNGRYDIRKSTDKLPELQNSSSKTVQRFFHSGLTIEQDFTRSIKFKDGFVFGIILRQLPGMCCPFSFRLGFFRSLSQTNGRNLYFHLNETSVFADNGIENNPILDMSGMDGFTVKLKMENNEISYTMTAYSRGQSFNTTFGDVLKLRKDETYDRLTITVRKARNVYLDYRTEYA